MFAEIVNVMGHTVAVVHFFLTLVFNRGLFEDRLVAILESFQMLLLQAGRKFTRSKPVFKRTWASSGNAPT